MLDFTSKEIHDSWWICQMLVFACVLPFRIFRCHYLFVRMNSIENCFLRILKKCCWARFAQQVIAALKHSESHRTCLHVWSLEHFLATIENLDHNLLVQLSKARDILWCAPFIVEFLPRYQIIVEAPLESLKAAKELATRRNCPSLQIRIQRHVIPRYFSYVLLLL